MEFLNAFSHLDWQQVMHLTWQHITLVGIAVTLAIVIGVPLGILMTRFPTLAGPLQASATVLLTVPSIALFGLLLPFYSSSARASGRCRRSLPCSSIRCCRSCATPTSPSPALSRASVKPRAASA